MLADPICRVCSAREGYWPTAKVQPERRFDYPLATTLPVTFISEFHQDCDKLAAVEQQERVAVAAVGPDSCFVG